MSFLNREPSTRTGSISAGRAGDAISRSFRRKLPSGAGSEDTDGATDDAGGDASGAGGRKEAIRARLKTVQPKVSGRLSALKESAMSKGYRIYEMSSFGSL